MSPSSYFFDEPCYLSQRFWNPEAMLDHQGKSCVLSPPLEKLVPGREKDMEFLEFSQPGLVRDQVAKLGIDKRVVGAEKARKLSTTSWRSADHSLGIGSNIFMHPASYVIESNKVNVEGQQENSLFSSTLSEIFSKKVRLSTNSVVFHKFAGLITSHNVEEESLEEIGAQTIWNLLPDEEDLLSSVDYKHQYNFQPNIGDDIEDFDLFSSGGGMELGEGDGLKCYRGIRNSVISGTNSNGLQKGMSGSIVENPSRTLLVRNMNSNVEDSELKALFEEYGDIHVLYTASKHRGYVMVSYYDIRAACAAIRSLQNNPLRSTNLDIHFSVPNENPSEKDINQGILVVDLNFYITNEELGDTFGVYGEIKEIRESPYKQHRKLIEFYDVRAAEAALCALHRTKDGHQCFATPSSPDLRRGQLIHRQMESSLFGAASNCAENGAITQLMESGRSPSQSHYGYHSPGTMTENGSCPLHGQHSMWSNSNSYQMWPPFHVGVWDVYQGESGLHPALQLDAHMFPALRPMSNSFEGNNGRREASCDNKRRRYDLDLDLILRGEDTRTTLMIKNIPNKYTSKMLLAAIDDNHRGTYDFIYLPIDFKNKCNVGYAFINLITPSQIVPFYQTFHGNKWEKFNSEKVASLAYARIQGKPALVSHFQNSSLMNEDKRCRPILFHSHGPNAGHQEPFPMGLNIRSRPGRDRTNGSASGSEGSSLSPSSSSSAKNSG